MGGAAELLLKAWETVSGTGIHDEGEICEWLGSAYASFVTGTGDWQEAARAGRNMIQFVLMT